MWVVTVGRTSQPHFGLLLGIGEKKLDTGGSVEASLGKTERARKEYLLSLCGVVEPVARQFAMVRTYIRKGVVIP